MKLRDLALGISAVALLSSPSYADLGYTQGGAAAGSAAVIFDFLCFSGAKHCSAHVPITSAGLELFTVSTPGNVNVTNSVLPVNLNAGSSVVGKFGIDQTTDITTNGVEIAPTAAAAAGIAPVVSTAVEANHVLKAGAGNLYGFQVTSGGTSGFVMVYNSVSAPADGAVTPAKCFELPANSTIGVDFAPIPMVLTTGITIGFSSTGCFTKTASATAFFSGHVK